MTTEEGVAIYSAQFRLTNFHNSEALAWGEFWGAVNIYADDQQEINWQG